MGKIDEKFKVKGYVDIKVYDKNGNLIDERKRRPNTTALGLLGNFETWFFGTGYNNEFIKYKTAGMALFSSYTSGYPSCTSQLLNAGGTEITRVTHAVNNVSITKDTATCKIIISDSFSWTNNGATSVDITYISIYFVSDRYDSAGNLVVSNAEEAWSEFSDVDLGGAITVPSGGTITVDYTLEITAGSSANDYACIGLYYWLWALLIDSYANNRAYQIYATEFILFTDSTWTCSCSLDFWDIATYTGYAWSEDHATNPPTVTQSGCTVTVSWSTTWTATSNITFYAIGYAFKTKYLDLATNTTGFGETHWLGCRDGITDSLSANQNITLTVTWTFTGG